MNIEILESDIDYQKACNAYRNISFTPEERAKSEQVEYVRIMKSIYEKLSKYAETDEQKEILQTEFERFKQNYISKYHEYLYAKGQTASTMITGPANFDTVRNQKRMNTEDKRLKELNELQEKATKAIIKKLKQARTIDQEDEVETRRLIKSIDHDLKAIYEIEYNNSPFNKGAFKNGISGIIERSGKPAGKRPPGRKQQR